MAVQITFLLSEMPEEVPESPENVSVRFIVRQLGRKFELYDPLYLKPLLMKMPPLQVVDDPLSAEALLDADIDNAHSVVLGCPMGLSYPHDDALVRVLGIGIKSINMIRILALQGRRHHLILISSYVLLQILSKIYEIQQLLQSLDNGKHVHIVSKTSSTSSLQVSVYEFSAGRILDGWPVDGGTCKMLRNLSCGHPTSPPGCSTVFPAVGEGGSFF